MRLHHAVLSILIAATVLTGLGCAAKRAVVYCSPDFHRRGVLKQQAAFLIAQPIDIGSMVQDYVRAFDGDPQAGASFTENALRTFLAGKEELEDPPVRLSLEDAGKIFSADSLLAAFTFERDKFGLFKLQLADGDRLSRIGQDTAIGYLVIICSLSVTRGFSVSSPALVPVPSGGSVIVGGGESKFASLSAQVFVWDVAAKAVLWNGFVRGTQGINFKFTRHTAKQVASWFAGDLVKALK